MAEAGRLQEDFTVDNAMDQLRERIASLETSVAIYAKQIEANAGRVHNDLAGLSKDLRAIDNRVSTLERKIAVITAVAALVGSLVGALANALIGSML